MDPEQDRRQCAACGDPEPLFTHIVSKNSGFRQLCTDCLLKEHRELFCPVCLNAFVDDVPPPQARIVCLNCPSITHLDCYRPPSSSAASSSSSSAAVPSFTCPPCSDPNFTFFSSKSLVPSSVQSGENDDDGTLDIESVTALVAAANIAAVSMNNAAAQLKNEAVKKVLEAKMAKKRAKEALGNLHDLVLQQKASENNNNPNKRKASDR